MGPSYVHALYFLLLQAKFPEVVSLDDSWLHGNFFWKDLTQNEIAQPFAPLDFDDATTLHVHTFFKLRTPNDVFPACA